MGTLQLTIPSCGRDTLSRGEEVESFIINEYIFKLALYVYCYLKGGGEFGLSNGLIEVSWKTTAIPYQYTTIQ